MKKITTILFFVICLFSCSAIGKQKIKFKEINLLDGIKIIFPLTNNFDENFTYMHIQIWGSNKKIFEDTTETEYLFDDKEWPKIIKAPEGLYLLYLKIFDAPDFNKLHQFTIFHHNLLKIDTLPFFYEPIKEIGGKQVYCGILNILETPCDNCDSCYYNPKLYYKLTENGIFLDSILTIKMNTIQWNGFYGFNPRIDIVRPCK